MAGDERQSWQRGQQAEEPLKDAELIRQRMAERLGESLDPQALEAAVKKVVDEMGIPRARETKVRPAEKRRRRRQMSVTFSSEEIPDRLRALAERWEMMAPDGRRPNFSAVIEYLLMPRLEAAENGKIGPPEE